MPVFSLVLIVIFCLEVLAQLTSVEIARLDVMTRVRTRDPTIMYEFNLSGLPFHLRQKKFKKISDFFICVHMTFKI